MNIPNVDAAGMLERRSGLLVPAPDLLDKKQRVMARGKFLRLLRHMDFSRAYGLASRFMCVECHEPVRIRRGEDGIINVDFDQSQINVRKDPFYLACRCTHWTIK